MPTRSPTKPKVVGVSRRETWFATPKNQERREFNTAGEDLVPHLPFIPTFSDRMKRAAASDSGGFLDTTERDVSLFRRWA